MVARRSLLSDGAGAAPADAGSRYRHRNGGAGGRGFATRLAARSVSGERSPADCARSTGAARGTPTGHHRHPGAADERGGTGGARHRCAASSLSNARRRSTTLPEGFLARAWAVARNAIAGLITVRKIDSRGGNIVTLEEQALRRQHLQLLLYSARAAVVRHDNTGVSQRAGAVRANGWASSST